MKEFYVNVPAWVMPLIISGYNEKEARQNFRIKHGFARLPKGTKVFERIVK